MIVEVFPVGPLQVNCTVLGCPISRKAVVVDPGADLKLIEDVLHKHELTVVLILNTHGHFDHVGANGALKTLTGAPLLIHAADGKLLQMASLQAANYGLTVENSPPADTELKDGDILKFGEQTLRVLHTPGHSPGGVCFYREGLLISGDTLFSGSIGRTDLPGGNHQQLLDSIQQKLAGLPAETQVVPGHGPMTTLDHEFKYNPYLGG